MHSKSEIKVQDSGPVPPAEAVRQLEQSVQPNETIYAIASIFGRYRLVLGRSRLVFEQRPFIFDISLTIHAVSMSDIGRVSGSVGPFFGILRFDLAAKGFPEQAGLFWRNDTIKMARIIQGYIEALRKGVDTRTIPLEQLVPQLLRAGTNDPSILIHD